MQRVTNKRGHPFGRQSLGDAIAGHLIPAKILAVDQHRTNNRMIVRILLLKYRGSFNTLILGENKPLMGFCRDGQLDLIYYRDPGLKEGQSFPLWTIQ